MMTHKHVPRARRVDEWWVVYQIFRRSTNDDSRVCTEYSLGERMVTRECVPNFRGVDE